MNIIHSGTATRCKIGWCRRGAIGGTFTVTKDTLLFEPNPIFDGSGKFRVEIDQQNVQNVSCFDFCKSWWPRWLSFVSPKIQGIVIESNHGTQLHMISLDVPVDMLVQKLKDFRDSRDSD